MCLESEGLFHYLQGTVSMKKKPLGAFADEGDSLPLLSVTIGGEPSVRLRV
jgi:hypothetical protein